MFDLKEKVDALRAAENDHALKLKREIREITPCQRINHYHLLLHDYQRVKTKSHFARRINIFVERETLTAALRVYANAYPESPAQRHRSPVKGTDTLQH